MLTNGGISQYVLPHEIYMETTKIKFLNTVAYT